MTSKSSQRINEEHEAFVAVPLAMDEPKQAEEPATEAFSWASCGEVVSLFFRRAFSEPESLVALIPEVLIDIILGLILFEKTEIAAAVMFVSIFGMGIVAALKVLTPAQYEDEEQKSVNRGDFNA